MHKKLELMSIEIDKNIFYFKQKNKILTSNRDTPNNDLSLYEPKRILMQNSFLFLNNYLSKKRQSQKEKTKLIKF